MFGSGILIRAFMTAHAQKHVSHKIYIGLRWKFVLKRLCLGGVRDLFIGVRRNINNTTSIFKNGTHVRIFSCADKIMQGAISRKKTHFNTRTHKRFLVTRKHKRGWIPPLYRISAILNAIIDSEIPFSSSS